MSQPTEWTTLPDNLSQPHNVALTSTGDDRFVLVNGAADDDTGAGIYRLRPDGSRKVAELDSPLVSPTAWTRTDGSVVIIGMQCGETTDASKSCPLAALDIVTLHENDETHVSELDVTTAGSVGFAAGPFGTDGVAIVTLDDTNESHVSTATITDAQVTDRGTVDLSYPAASLVCDVEGRSLVLPAGSSESNGNAEVYEVSGEGVTKAGTLMTSTNERPSAVSGCSDDGKVLVSVLDGGKTDRSIVSAADPANSEPVDLAAPYDAGQVSLAGDGRLLAWTNIEGRDAMGGEATWKLSARADGTDTWRVLGELLSSEPPQQTVAGPDAVAVIVAGGDGVAVEIIG